MAKNLTPAQKRCEDCTCLIIKDKKWCCDECFGASVEEVDDCPEGFTLAEVEENQSKTIKVNLGARAESAEKNRKPRTVKISDEKHSLFENVLTFLEQNYDSVEVLKANKLLSVNIGGKTFKIDLIEQRKK